MKRLSKGLITAFFGLFFAGSVLATIPREKYETDSVTIQEYNTVFNEKGKVKFDQMIYWEVCEECNNYHFKVVDWRFCRCESIIPHKNYKTGKFEAIFYEDNILRKIKSDVYLRTHSNYDPEVNDRSIHKHYERRGLSCYK